MESSCTSNHHMFSDVSGSFGCGAWWNGLWFQLKWPKNCKLELIACKELLLMIMGCVIWGRHWFSQRVMAHCDNEAVISVVNFGYSSDPQMMQLLRSLFFITAWHRISIWAVHILGRDNSLADTISCNHMELFFQQAPQASTIPFAVPAALLDLLIRPTWSRLFISFSQLDLRPPRRFMP